MANQRPASDDDVDWSSYLDDNLDDLLMEVVDASICNTSTIKIDTKPAEIEVITMDDYDEDDEQLLEAIALSLRKNSSNKSSSSSVQTMQDDVQFLPGCSTSTSSKISDADLAAIATAMVDLENNSYNKSGSSSVQTRQNDVQLLPGCSTSTFTTMSGADLAAISVVKDDLEYNSRNKSGSSSVQTMQDVQFLPGCSISTSSKMSDADLAAVSAAMADLENAFNAKQAVADEETLQTIKAIEIADMLEIEDQQLESYNPIHAATIRSLPIVHPDLEHLDPNPDIYQLFREFDTRFFQGLLTQKALRLDWAKNFYSLAGAFYPFKDGVPTILLSANLLTLRPRRDLVETLIHEMIHAYIHLKRLRDTGEHGSIFHSHMNRINAESGTNITVYHNFNNEVSYLRKYIWRCSGSVCRAIGPYCGYINLPTKRRPNKWDKAYRIHLERGCTGTFEQASTNFHDDKQKKILQHEEKKLAQEREKEKKKMERELEKEKKKMEREKEKETSRNMKK